MHRIRESEVEGGGLLLVYGKIELRRNSEKKEKRRG